jgi:NADH-quinone oxidoreductase subunit M
MLSDRRHTRLISEFGGLKTGMPRLTAVMLIITLSSIGLPGMNGFIGEFLIMLGAFKWDPRFVVIAALGVILSAVYMLWMFQRVFYGEVTNDHNKRLPDLSFREWAILGPLAAAAIGMGVFPNVFLKPMEPAVQRIVDRVQSSQPVTAEAVIPYSARPKPKAPGTPQRPKAGAPQAHKTSGPEELKTARPQDLKTSSIEVQQ